MSGDCCCRFRVLERIDFFLLRHTERGVCRHTISVCLTRGRLETCIAFCMPQYLHTRAGAVVLNSASACIEAHNAIFPNDSYTRACYQLKWVKVAIERRQLSPGW